MSTVLDIIKASLMEINVRSIGETVDADQAADALAALNRMVDQWAAERLMIYSPQVVSSRVLSLGQTYTVGTAGDFAVARPVFLSGVTFSDPAISPTFEIPLTELTDDAYRALPIKTLPSAYPTSYYFNPTYPLATLTLWPAPTLTNLVGKLYAPQAVTQFAGLTTTISLPNGYEEALVTNLALRLATGYGRQVDPNLRERAMTSRGIVKAANARPMDLSFDAGSLCGNAGAGWSIYTDS